MLNNDLFLAIKAPIKVKCVYLLFLKLPFFFRNVLLWPLMVSLCFDNWGSSDGGLSDQTYVHSQLNWLHWVFISVRKMYKEKANHVLEILNAQANGTNIHVYVASFRVQFIPEACVAV